jgi:hypothetical protein
MADWNFPLTGGGAEYGINESGIETFKSGLDKSLAREVIQNSLDARDNQEKPVEVSFFKFDISKEELPGGDRLQDIFEKAKAYYATDRDAASFYNEAIKVVSGAIPCLKISDFNTKGLCGTSDQKEESTFYALTKAMGVSNKTQSSGGSFGIGKSAPFSMSSLRTVFYSTYNIDDEYKLLGVSRLTTFEDLPGEKRQNVGFYGNLNNEKQVVDELTNFDEMPKKLRRGGNNGAGTDITIIGYKAEQEWTEGLLNAVLNEFYPAIYYGNLIVKLVDKNRTVDIDKETLGNLMAEYANNKGDSYPYYLALSSPDYNFSESLDILGNCHLFIKKNDEFPSKVQWSRSPLMVVRSKRYGSPEAYSALFICDDSEKGDRILRSLEPPAHNDWKSSLWDPIKNRDISTIKSYGNMVLFELESWIRKKLEEISAVKEDHIVEIEGLGEYLPDTEVGNFTAEDLQDDLLDINTSVAKKESPISKPRVGTVKPVRPGEKPSKPKAPHKKESGGAKSGGAEEQPRSDKKRILTSSVEIRSREINNGNKRLYVLSMLPNEDTSGDLNIVARGETGYYGMDLDYAENSIGSRLEVEGSFIKNLQMKKGVPEKITIKLNDDGRYSIGVENYV